MSFQNFQNGYLQKMLERTFPIITSILQQKCVYENIINKNNSGSRSQTFCKIGVLKNFVKFRGKLLYRSLFFNKVASWMRNFIKKTPARVFYCEFCEFVKINFYTEHLGTAVFTLHQNQTST